MRVKGAQRSDGIFKQLDPDRLIPPGRKQIDDFAPGTKGPFSFHQRAAAVAKPGQAVQESLPSDLQARPQDRQEGPPGLHRHNPGEEGCHRGYVDAGAAGGGPFKKMQPLLERFGAHAQQVPGNKELPGRKKVCSGAG